MPHPLLIRPKNLAPAKIKAQTTDAGEATVWLYDAIDDYYGVNAKDFAQALVALDADTIHLRINSPGGDVFGARAMVAAIRGVQAAGRKVTAHIDGLAASAATFIACACNEVHMADGAFYMIHQASTFACGDAAQLRDTADLLDKADDSIVADYAAKTGQDAQQLRDWMAAETWFTAAEAKAAGFADVVVDAPVRNLSAEFDFSACANAPKALTAPPPAAPVEDGARARAACVMALLNIR